MFDNITTPQDVEGTEEITLRLPIAVIEKFKSAAKIFSKDGFCATPEVLMVASIRAMYEENLLEEIVLSMMEDSPSDLKFSDLTKDPTKFVELPAVWESQLKEKISYQQDKNIPFSRHLHETENTVVVPVENVQADDSFNLAMRDLHKNDHLDD